MTSYKITTEQKELLEILVAAKKEERLREPIIVFTSNDGDQISGFGERFFSNLKGNMLALCEEGLLTFENNSKGNKIYTLKQSGIEAVENEFVMPSENVNPTISVGAIVKEMKGGNLQAVGFSNESEISQIINDKELLATKIDDLTGQLISVVKNELSSIQYPEYLNQINNLKKELKKEKPSGTIIQKIVTAISFLGDIEGTFELTARVLPYVLPLIQVAVRLIEAQ